MRTEQQSTETVTVVVSEVAHALIGSDRVEGTPVYRPTGERIGRIEKVMIDKLSGNVAFAVMSFGGFLGMVEDQFPIPWPMLSYNTALGGYQVDIDESQLEAAQRFAPSDTENMENRLQIDQLYRYYNTPPDWYEKPSGRD